MENIFSPAESFICSSFYLFLVHYVFPKLYNFYIFWLITNFNFSALCLSMPLTMLLLASGGTPDEGIFCLPDQRWAHFGSWTFIEECGLPGQSHAWSYQIKLAEICKKEHFLEKKTNQKNFDLWHWIAEAHSDEKNLQNNNRHYKLKKKAF